MHIYLCGKNLENYGWLLLIDLQTCHEWLVNSLDGLDICIDLCLYIFPPLLFFIFLQKSSPNVNSKWKRDYELQKPVAHTSIWLGKRESDSCIEMYGAQIAKG